MDILSPFFHTGHVLIWLLVLPIVILLVYIVPNIIWPDMGVDYDPPPIWGIILLWGLVPILYAHSETTSILATVPGIALLGKLGFLALDHPILSLFVTATIWKTSEVTFEIVDRVREFIHTGIDTRRKVRAITRGYAKTRAEYRAVFPGVCTICCSRYFSVSYGWCFDRTYVLVCKKCKHKIPENHFLYDYHDTVASLTLHRINSSNLTGEQNESFPELGVLLDLTEGASGTRFPS